MSEEALPEDPTLAMLERAVRVAAATGADITETQAHDIWQAMMDEFRWNAVPPGLSRDDR